MSAEENFHFYVEIRRGKQQDLLREIFDLLDKYKDSHKGWISLVGTVDELIDVLKDEGDE